MLHENLTFGLRVCDLILRYHIRLLQRIVVASRFLFRQLDAKKTEPKAPLPIGLITLKSLIDVGVV